jgi:hypothetical protein
VFGGMVRGFKVSLLTHSTAVKSIANRGGGSLRAHAYDPHQAARHALVPIARPECANVVHHDGGQRLL